jgi:hypothetical protein
MEIQNDRERARPFNSRVSIVNLKETRNKAGLLAKRVIPVTTTPVEIYRTAVNSTTVNLNINITNSSATPSKIRLWVSDKNLPVLEDLYESGVKLDPDATFIRSYILLSNNEALFAMSDTLDNVIRIDGSDDRTSF